MNRERLFPRFFRDARGFTLIETLVAVMILAISLVVVMQLFSGGLKSSRIATDYMHGIFHAKEKMEELLVLPDLLPGAYSGDFEDGYRWQAVVELIEETPPDTEEEPAGPELPVAALDVRLEVFWKSGLREKRFDLETMVLADRKRVAPPAEAP